MDLYFKKKFIKKFKKLPVNIRAKFSENIKLFKINTHNSILNNHALHGTYANCRSINVTGDLRAVYKTQNKNRVLFVDIDNHPNLYK